jgi:Tol biopolymer transport system component
MELALPEAVTRRVTTSPGWEGNPFISPDGKFLAYVSIASGNLDVWLVDVDGHKPIRVDDHPATDFDPAWFPDGKSLAFVSDRTGENAVWKTAILGGSPSLIVNNAKNPSVSPDSKRIAFVRPGPNGDDRIAVAPLSDPSQGRFLTDDDGGLWNHDDPAWSPDGTRICYTAHRNLWMVPSNGGPARMLTTDDQLDFEPFWSHNGKYIYFSSYRTGTTAALWRISAAGGRPVRITTGTASESSPSVSLDGSRLAYSTLIEDYRLVLLDLDSGQERTLEEDCSLEQPAISPDKSLLVYTANREGMRFDLWSQPLVDGAPHGSPRRLTDQEGNASHPVFSPDGRWIAYYRALGSSRNVWIVSSTGGRPYQITNHPAQEIQPTWSPDGAFLAFVSSRDSILPSPNTQTSQIWLVPVDEGRPSGPPRQLTSGDKSVTSPVFSPNGEEIAFICKKNAESDVWVVPIDGGSPPRRLTDGAGAGRLRWIGPPGDALLVSGNWRTSRDSLRKASVHDGRVTSFVPEIVFGIQTPFHNFDVSPDGRLICYTRQERKGSIWVLEAEAGSY